MRVRSILTVAGIALVLSTLIAVLGAMRQWETTVMLAAGLFALQVLLLALRVNLPLWASDARAESAEWAFKGAVLTAVTYAWGAAVMFAVYSAGGLEWRHWWQYGAGMALLAAATLACTRALIGTGTRPASGKALATLMLATKVQVAAIAVALVYLVASGKLATPKDDWAANIVFITGGLTVLAISLLSLLTWRRLGRGGGATA